MRKLFRSMAKAKMAAMGYGNINRRMRGKSGNQWRKVTEAYPTEIHTGEKMRPNFRGRKRYKKGHRNPVFVY